MVVRWDIWRIIGGGAKAYKESVTNLRYMQKKKNAGRNIQPKHYRG
jgi:hypothetical protein